MRMESATSLFISITTFLIGGVDLTIKVLLVFVVADFVTGFLKAWKGGIYTSKQFREGLANKSGYFIVLILAYQMDLLLFDGVPTTRTAAVFFYVWIELSSIIENLGQMGIKVPPILSDHMERLNKLSNDKKEGEK